MGQKLDPQLGLSSRQRRLYNAWPMAMLLPLCAMGLYRIYQANQDQRVMEIVVTQTPNESVERAVDTGLETHGRKFIAEPEAPVPLQVYCRNADGRIIGGLLGNTGNTWLHIWQLWVAEAYRNQSFGSQILAAAEREAIHRNCRRAHLETLSFQGVRFYLDQGYEEFGVLPDYVGSYSQHFLRKILVC